MFGLWALSTVLPLRFDITEDKLYSLSPATHNILQQLQPRVRVKLYWSRSVSGAPQDFKNHGQRIADILAEYQSKSSGNLSVEVIDPIPLSRFEDEAFAAKLDPRWIDEEPLFLGAVFEQGKMQKKITFFTPEREAYIEYDISQTLAQITKDQPTKLRLLSSYDLEKDKRWSFIAVLKQVYDLGILDYNKTRVIPDDTDVLFVFHPHKISIAVEYAIDQFIMKGGRVLLAVDPFARESLENLAELGAVPTLIPDVSSTLPNIIGAWRLIYDPKRVVSDHELSTIIDSGVGRVGYPFMISLAADQMGSDSVVSADLKSFLYSEGGGFWLDENTTLQLTPLMETSQRTGFLEARKAGFTKASGLLLDVEVSGGVYTLAGILSGVLPSGFAGVPEQITNGSPHLLQSQRSTEIILIADTDFLADRNYLSSQNGRSGAVKPIRDNFDFLLNAIDYLGGDERMLGIRGRQLTRPFTRKREIQEKARQLWKKKFTELTEDIYATQTKISQIKQKIPAHGVFELNPAQAQALKVHQEKLGQLKISKRRVFRTMHEKIDELENKLIVFNLLLVPLPLVFLALIFFYLRQLRDRRQKALALIVVEGENIG